MCCRGEVGSEVNPYPDLPVSDHSRVFDVVPLLPLAPRDRCQTTIGLPDHHRRGYDGYPAPQTHRSTLHSLTVAWNTLKCHDSIQL